MACQLFNKEKLVTFLPPTLAGKINLPNSNFPQRKLKKYTTAGVLPILGKNNVLSLRPSGLPIQNRHTLHIEPITPV